MITTISVRANRKMKYVDQGNKGVINSTIEVQDKDKIIFHKSSHPQFKILGNGVDTFINIQKWE